MRAPSAVPFRAAAALRAAAFLLCFALRPGHAAASTDSLVRFEWGAQYRSRLALVRTSERFPWNDEETSSHLADRLAVFGGLRPCGAVGVFLKGATGLRLDGGRRENRATLEQGHIAVDLGGGRLAGRLFLRERAFRTSHRLLPIVSDDSPFLAGRGQGIRLTADAGYGVRLDYIESSLRDAPEAGRTGGLPLFRGGADLFRLVRIEAGRYGGMRAGVLLSQVGSTARGDAVTVGADIAFGVRGIAVDAELARSHRGDWGDLARQSLFDLRLEELDLDSPSGVFSENDAFSAEISGISLDTERFGSAGIVPGYRFCGASFANAQGELEPGTDEARFVAWWRPPSSDVLVSIDGSDGSRDGARYRGLVGSLRMRFRGGLDLSGHLVAAQGSRAAGALSIGSDTRLARTRLTARIDDLGNGHDVSFFAESSVNLTGRLAAGGAVYLFDSRTSRYAIACEFRPKERFLLTIAAGSFMPGLEEAALRLDPAAPGVPEERAVVVTGRVWAGGW